MMDAYSNLPAPDKDKATLEVYGKIIQNQEFNNINRDMILNITKEYMKEYPEENMGSFTGWYVFTLGEIVEDVQKILRKKVNLSRIIIMNFISKQIWNTEYIIGKKMFDFRCQKDGIVFEK